MKQRKIGTNVSSGLIFLKRQKRRIDNGSQFRVNLPRKKKKEGKENRREETNTFWMLCSWTLERATSPTVTFSAQPYGIGIVQQNFTVGKKNLFHRSETNFLSYKAEKQSTFILTHYGRTSLGKFLRICTHRNDFVLLVSHSLFKKIF